MPELARAIATAGGQRALLAVVFLLIYGADAGRGFISDDFAWIAHGRLEEGPSAVARVFTTAVGFYRPLTALSFGVNHALFGMDATGYGLTNLALALLCAALVVLLARELGLDEQAATGAAALWLFNFHGINMSVLWLSGRTSLLLTAFSAMAAIAMLRNRPLLSAVAAGAAMLSKEEAVVLPAMLTAWWALGRGGPPAGWRRAVAELGGLWAVLGIYLLLRLNSGAFWMDSAPAFYRPTFEVASVLRNLAEYADRSLTTSAAALLLLAAYARRRPALDAGRRDLVVRGAVWFVLGFALTAFLPVRSSLYALFPGVGSALAAGALAAGLARGLTASQIGRVQAAALVLLLALVPVYWTRNVRWTELASLSATVIEQLHAHEAEVPAGGTVVIVDDDTSRVNLANAWAGLTPEMARLSFHGRFDVVVRGPREAPRTGSNSLEVRLERGRLVGWPSRLISRGTMQSCAIAGPCNAVPLP